MYIVNRESKNKPMFLKLDKISKSYGKPGNRSYRRVIEGLDLELEKGAGMAIVGPSGSGKTTLLNLMGLLDSPDSGNYFLEGKDLASIGEKERTRLRNRTIGFVFQSHFLMPQYNVWENILLPTLPAGRPGKETLDRAESLLKRTGIWDLRYQKPSTLSGGECQRTAVVRSLINSPALLLADEPTGALDEENAGMIMDLLVGLNREMKVTTVVITHSMEMARKLETLRRLKNGKLEALQ
jgi:ABC-type lipoprotein export system ATPase subunit